MKKSRTDLRKATITSWDQWAIGLGILAISLLLSFFFILEAAAKPFEDSQATAVQLAKQYVHLQDIQSVTRYNGLETYYSIIGTKKAGEEVVVFVPETSSDIFVFALSGGISQAEAVEIARQQGAQTVESAILGYEDGQPIWEIKSGTAYYLIGFESGQLVKKEGL